MNPFRSRLRLFLAAALLCANLMAQESGSLTGQVLDPTGAAIIDAKVEVKNNAMGSTFTTRSDQTGFYRVPQLLPGTYTITTSAEGFRTLVREGIVVQVNDRLRVDMALAIGQVGDTITVEGQTPLLQTEDATAGQVINTQKILDLPLNSRNWLQLATLAPGTVTYPGVADLQAGNSQNIAMNLGGARQSQANFILDGTDNTNFTSGGAVTYPPVDSLQEFKVETNNYTADVGRLGGPVVNASIKSGSNQLHGSVYDFLRNRELNARNFFANPTATKPEFTRNQFGASAGAPVIRNKLFVFLNYEGNRQRQDQIVSTQVFTAAQKTGNFASQLGAVVGQDGLGRSVAAGQIFDPYSVSRLPSGAAIRDAFPGNIIPASRMNPVAQKLINLVPGPNTSGSPNFIADLSSPLDIDTFAGRVDFVHSTRDTVFGHFIYSDQSSVTAPIFGLPVDGNTGLLLASNNRQLGAGWTHVFSPTNLSEFRLSYTRNLRLTLPAQSDQDVNSQFGIALPYPGNGVGGLANMSISGYTTLGTQSGTFPQYMNKYELSENYTLIRGRHTFKFGAQAETKLFQNHNSCNNCRGVYNFNGVYTQQIGFSNTGSAVADFLSGVINTSNFANVRNVTAVGHDLDLYVQDKWAINRKLTMTLGVRYQYHPPSTAKRGAITNVVFGPGFVNPQVVVGQNLPDTAFLQTKNVLLPYIPVVRQNDVGLDGGLVHNTAGALAPRLGIAYQLAPKTVLRTAGYGIFYGYLDASSGGLTANPPGNLGISTSGNTVDPTLVLGQPTFGSNPFNRALSAPAFIGIRDPNWKPEFTQMYNLSIQHQFSGSWLVEAGFMGNNSSRLSVIVNDNDASPVPPSNTSTPQSRRRVSTNLGDLPCYCPQGFSHYNALTLNVEKRLSSGLTLLANYTWSRALGFAPPLYWGINSASILDPLNLKREYGPLEFDVIKRFVVSYTYDLPFGKGKPFGDGVSPILNQVIGGWQFSGITTMQGGFPFTPTLSTSLGKTFTNSRPNAVGDPTASARQPYNWINPAAFVVPLTAEVAAGNYFGNAGRGSLREPGLVNFDFSVMKNASIREGMRLQFRAEFYNLTNTPFLGGNGAVTNNFNSPNFGKVTQAGDPRVIQLGLKLLF